MHRLLRPRTRGRRGSLLLLIPCALVVVYVCTVNWNASPMADSEAARPESWTAQTRTYTRGLLSEDTDPGPAALTPSKGQRVSKGSDLQLIDGLPEKGHSSYVDRRPPKEFVREPQTVMKRQTVLDSEGNMFYPDLPEVDNIDFNDIVYDGDSEDKKYVVKVLRAQETFRRLVVYVTTLLKLDG